MATVVIERLYRIASRQVEINAMAQNFARTLRPEQVADPLRELAAWIGDKPEPEGPIVIEEAMAALRTFFTHKSIYHLLELPNLFWFWIVVKEAALLHYENDKASPPRVKIALREAFHNVRQGVRLGNNYFLDQIDLNNEIEDLGPVEAAFWQANGIMLIEKTGNSYARVRNPIFHKDYMFSFDQVGDLIEPKRSGLLSFKELS